MIEDFKFENILKNQKLLNCNMRGTTTLTNMIKPTRGPTNAMDEAGGYLNFQMTDNY